MSPLTQTTCRNPVDASAIAPDHRGRNALGRYDSERSARATVLDETAELDVHTPQAYQVESYVTWCGHAQKVIPWPKLTARAGPRRGAN